MFERDIGCGSKFLCCEMPLKNSAEGRTTNFKSVWFLPTAGKKILHLSRMPVNICPWLLCCEGEQSWESWSLFWAVHGAGGLMGTEGEGSTTLSHLPDWRPKATWCKIRHDGPSQHPFSSRPIHSWMVSQGWRIGCLRCTESLTSSFYTILNPLVSQDLLCELLLWPFPPFARKSAPSMSGSCNSYFWPCYFGNFEFLFFCF